VKITTCSWSTRLYSTLKRSASGVVSPVECRKTAVPGTRCGGSDVSRSSVTNAWTACDAITAAAVASTTIAHREPAS
jgi:hypothetical protein